jgi:hypothetical protein
MLFLRHCHHSRGLIKHHKARACRTLIDRSNVVFHGRKPHLPGRSILRESRRWFYRNNPHPAYHGDANETQENASLKEACELGICI